MKLLDSHVHIGKWPRLDLSMTLDDLDLMMKEYDYSGAVVIPPLDNRDDPVEMNRKLQRQVEHREDLFFFPWFHVTDDGSNELEMLNYLNENLDAISGVKVHASISQMDVTDKHLAAMLNFLDEHRLPLLYHCGRHPISAANPVKRIAPSYPHITFMVAHLGGNAYDLVVDTIKLFEGDLPENIYFDTSTARHPKLLKRAIATYGEGRLLFGTDLPFTEMNMNWACLEFAGVLHDEQIMGGNLLRILTRSS